MVDFDKTPLVSTQWLADNLSAPDLRVVDASYYLPHEGLNARAEFELQHIPGAVFFDIDDISDDSSSLPHMLPPPEKFSSRVRKLGLGDGVRIVVYDQRGIFSAPRVWWTFRYFGHRDIAVLDGGLVKWMNEERPLESGPFHVGERHFTPRVDNLMLRDKPQIMRNLDTRREVLVDARGPGRFDGSDEEVWPGRRAGHIPGSLNLPFTDLIDAASQTLRPHDELRQRFAALGTQMRRGVRAQRLHQLLGLNVERLLRAGLGGGVHRRSDHRGGDDRVCARGHRDPVPEAGGVSEVVGGVGCSRGLVAI